jgi:hypothetical protein
MTPGAAASTTGKARINRLSKDLLLVGMSLPPSSEIHGDSRIGKEHSTNKERRKILFVCFKSLSLQGRGRGPPRSGGRVRAVHHLRKALTLPLRGPLPLPYRERGKS